MSFLKWLVGPGVLPSVQATQAPYNPFLLALRPIWVEREVMMFSLVLLLGFVMTSNKHEILTKFLEAQASYISWF